MKGVNVEEHKPDEETIKAFASKENIDLEAARERLNKRYQAEVESVDPREMSLKCLRAMRQALPKIQGLELREAETQAQLKKALNKIDALEKENELIKKICKQAVDTVNVILKESEQSHAIQSRTIEGVRKTINENYSVITETMMGNYEPRLEKLEEQLKPSFIKRLCQKLISTLKR